MSDTKHIIQTQIIELHLSRNLDRVAIQNKVSHIFRQSLLPVLDELLTANKSTGTLVIDRMEIDVGRIPASRLEEMLTQKFGEALAENLTNIRPTTAADNSTTKRATTTASHQDEPHTEEALVLYFLQTGVFPWWAKETTTTYFEQSFHSALRHQLPGFRHVLTLLLQEDQPIQRLVFSANPVLLAEVAEWITGQRLSFVLSQTEPLFKLFEQRLNAAQLQEFWWYSWYHAIAATSEFTATRLFEKAGHLFIELSAESTNHASLLHFFKSIKRSDGVLNTIVAFHQYNAAVGEKFNGQQDIITAKFPKKGASIQLLEASGKVNRMKTAAMFTKDNIASHPIFQVDKLYIHNAGLVLLWPFLERFFLNLDLTNEKAFTGESQAIRGCLLLEYLVTGHTEETFEAQLPLNKLLCGIPLQQPLPTQWTITDEETVMAEHFLNAVIKNGGEGWTHLSVHGLRQAYLHREGILSGRDGNWRLQIKREPYDVLVDRLPWTVQLVKLPWMARLVIVEW